MKPAAWNPFWIYKDMHWRFGPIIIITKPERSRGPTIKLAGNIQLVLQPRHLQQNITITQDTTTNPVSAYPHSRCTSASLPNFSSFEILLLPRKTLCILYFIATYTLELDSHLIGLLLNVQKMV